MFGLGIAGLKSNFIDAFSIVKKSLTKWLCLELMANNWQKWCCLYIKILEDHTYFFLSLVFCCSVSKQMPRLCPTAYLHLLCRCGSNNNCPSLLFNGTKLNQVYVKWPRIWTFYLHKTVAMPHCWEIVVFMKIPEMYVLNFDDFLKSLLNQQNPAPLLQETFPDSPLSTSLHFPNSDIP